VNYCFFCGKKLTSVPTGDGWVGWYSCGCGQHYELTYSRTTCEPETFRFLGTKPFAKPQENPFGFAEDSGNEASDDIFGF
jgi:hypothetical protein